jgi:hypothetical protein
MPYDLAKGPISFHLFLGYAVCEANQVQRRTSYASRMEAQENNATRGIHELEDRNEQLLERVIRNIRA